MQNSPLILGSVETKGGRITPLSLPISVNAAAKVAPVFPGEKKPTASFF